VPGLQRPAFLAGGYAPGKYSAVGLFQPGICPESTVCGHGVSFREAVLPASRNGTVCPLLTGRERKNVLEKIFCGGTQRGEMAGMDTAGSGNARLVQSGLLANSSRTSRKYANRSSMFNLSGIPQDSLATLAKDNQTHFVTSPTFVLLAAVWMQRFYLACTITVIH